MKNKIILMSVLAMFLVMTFASAASITRTAPSTVSAGSSFQVTYSAVGASGKWGSIIVDNVSGGCSFPNGNEYKDALLSTSGTTKTVTLTAPASGLCTFSGYYQFGDMISKDYLPQLTISVGSVCGRVTTCAANTCSNQTCSDGCGGVVQGTKNCSTSNTNWGLYIGIAVGVGLLILLLKKK